MSISGHKIYGPKGEPKHFGAVKTKPKRRNNVGIIRPGPLLLTGPPTHVCTGVGALYVRRRPRVRLEPLQSGGGQERGLRSGTVPTPLAVGLGAACSIAQQEMEVKPTIIPWKVNGMMAPSDPSCLCLCMGEQYDHQRVSMLANRLVQKIMSAIPDVVMNGDPNQRYPGTHTHTHSYKLHATCLWCSATCQTDFAELFKSARCHSTHVFLQITFSERGWMPLTRPFLV